MSITTRRSTATGLAALSAGLLVALAGCGTTSDAPVPTTGPAPTAASTVTAQPAATTAGRASRPTPPPTSRPAPQPTTPPAGQPATRYAELVDVWHVGPSAFALVYDRVDLLTGEAAAAYYRAHPDQEPLDFAVVNESTELSQLPVATSGTFFGNQLLGPGNGDATARITGDELISRLKTHPRTLVQVTERPVENHWEVLKLSEVYLP